VLRELIGVSVPLNAAQIAGRAGLTRPAAGTVLGEFAAMGLTANVDVGNARVHWLVRDNVYVQELVKRVFEFESRMPDMLLEDLRDTFGDAAESVVLFGSYARGDQRPDSDIDVVLVGIDAQQKARLHVLVADESASFRRRWGASLSVLTFTLDEAAELRRTSPGLLRSLEEDGVVVSGRAPWEWKRGSEEG
jgi:predicted nucleotidyltransferase